MESSLLEFTVSVLIVSGLLFAMIILASYPEIKKGLKDRRRLW